MKKLFILFAVSVVTLAANAQQIAQVSKKEMKEEKKEVRKEKRQIAGQQVAYQSKEAFTGDFGNVPNAVWHRDNFFDAVSFTKDGVKQTAYYDDNFELVGTIFPKSFNDLPKTAQDYISKKYAGYQKGKVIMFDDNEFNDTDMMLYGVKFEDADNYFIEMQKGKQDFVLQVTPEGNVLFFTEMKK